MIFIDWWRKTMKIYLEKSFSLTSDMLRDVWNSGKEIFV